MLQKYKEIFFGIAFGIAAFILDTAMDAAAEGNSYWDELKEHPAMILYRVVFILLGFVLGWLLWKNNAREREFRRVTETLDRLQQNCGTQIVLLRSKLQILLTRDDLHLSGEARGLVEDVYQTSREFQGLVERGPRLTSD